MDKEIGGKIDNELSSKIENEVGRDKRKSIFWPMFVFFFPALAFVAGMATLVIAINTPSSLVNVSTERYGKSTIKKVSEEILALSQASSANMWIRESGKIDLMIDTRSEQLDEVVVYLNHATQAEKDRVYLMSNTVDAMVAKAPNDQIKTQHWYTYSPSGDQHLAQKTGKYKPGKYQIRLNFKQIASPQNGASLNEKLIAKLNEKLSDNLGSTESNSNTDMGEVGDRVNVSNATGLQVLYASTHLPHDDTIQLTPKLYAQF